jgi:hypothetical protein
MADWTAEITPDGQPKHKLHFFARDEAQVKEFLEQHLSFVGGEVHQIRKVELELEDDNDFDDDNPRPLRAARKTLGGY